MKKALWEYRDDRFDDSSQRNYEVFYMYDLVQDEWNSAHSRNANILELRFGLEFRTFYEKNIHDSFRELHIELDDIVNKTNFESTDDYKLALSNLKDKINHFSTDIDKFNVMLIKQIQGIDNIQ